MEEKKKRKKRKLCFKLSVVCWSASLFSNRNKFKLKALMGRKVLQVNKYLVHGKGITNIEIRDEDKGKPS